MDCVIYELGSVWTLSEHAESYLYLTLCLSDLAPQEASAGPHWQRRSEKITTSSDEIRVMGIGKGPHRVRVLRQCV